MPRVPKELDYFSSKRNKAGMGQRSPKMAGMVKLEANPARGNISALREVSFVSFLNSYLVEARGKRYGVEGDLMRKALSRIQTTFLTMILTSCDGHLDSPVDVFEIRLSHYTFAY